MSTNAECRFNEIEPGVWTQYWLQDWPYGATPNGETYGPFRSFRAAKDHLDTNHANPGGFNVKALPDGQHVHEWDQNGAEVPVGVEVTVRVESLGPDPAPAAVIAAVKALPADSRAWHMYPVYGWRDDVVVCIACGRSRPTAS